MTFGVPAQSLRVDHQSPGSAPGVVIVQAYNDALPDTLTDWSHSVALNSIYAKRHNYSHRLYQFKKKRKPLSPGACHDKSGNPLGSHWCKVIAISDAMDDFPETNTFVWLDTDAAFRNMNTSVLEFMQSSNIMSTPCHHEGVKPTHHYNIWSFMNKHKWGCLATTFALILQRSEVTDSIFSEWLSMRGKNGQHDQYSFVDIYEKRPNDIALSVEQPVMDHPGQFVHHRCGGCTWLPTASDMMAQISVENNIGMDDISGALNGIDVKHMDGRAMERRLTFWNYTTT